MSRRDQERRHVRRVAHQQVSKVNKAAALSAATTMAREQKKGDKAVEQIMKRQGYKRVVRTIKLRGTDPLVLVEGGSRRHLTPEPIRVPLVSWRRFRAVEAL